jgi:putative membrane protein
MGFGFVVERFGLFLQLVAHQSISNSQRGFSLAAGELLLLLGAAVALISARQFRQVAKNLDPSVVPPGYWTQVGVVLNVLIALLALGLALRFLLAAQTGG